jgi:glutaredoxin
MDYLRPMDNMYTIYTKPGCIYCKMVIELLHTNNKPIDEVPCEEYIAHSKPQFFQFISDIAGRNHRTFPVVFSNGRFIGGYTETKSFLESG